MIAPRSSGDGPHFRLALARGGLGLELDGDFRFGALRVIRLDIRYPDLRFPMDLSGGVRRFRHLRGRLAAATVEIELSELAQHLERGVAKIGVSAALGGKAAPPAAAALPHPDGLTLGVTMGPAVLAFEVAFVPTEATFRAVVHRPRGKGLHAPSIALGCRLVAAALGARAARTGSIFLAENPLIALLRALLPDAGVRVPDAKDVRLLQPRVEAGALRFQWSDAAPLVPELSACRALEAALLLREADDHLIAGDAEAARGSYLGALERAPRHLESSLRLAELDLFAGDRVRAASTSVSAVSNLVDAGLLGAQILEELGEAQAAATAYVMTGATEPFGPLSALAWESAAALEGDPVIALDHLGQAIARAPAAEGPRWARFRRWLDRGDVRSALGEAEHLLAANRPRSDKHAVATSVAKSLSVAGFFEEALRWFDVALRLEPTSKEARLGLAKNLCELGRTAQGLALYQRIALGPGDGIDGEAMLQFAEALAEFGGDRPAAIVRVASISQGAAVAPRARFLEGEWRALLNDGPGASKAFARLRALGEFEVPADPEELSRYLARSAPLLRDLERAQEAKYALHLAIKVWPGNRKAAQLLMELSHRDEPDPAADGSAALPSVLSSPPLPPSPQGPEVSPTVAEPDPGALPEHGWPFDSLKEEGEAELSAELDVLTDRLRADPADGATFRRLVLVLTALGRDLELLALVSARLEEHPLEPGGAEIRNAVLGRLAETARREGRQSEAELYEAMRGAEPSG